MNPVNWFEIPAKDINESKTFYEAVFGIEMQLTEMGPLKMAWFPMEQDAPNATGTLVEAESYNPSYDGTMVYFSVESIEDTLVKAKENGGKVITEKMDIGEYGFVGHFEDNAGNRVGIHSTK